MNYIISLAIADFKLVFRDSSLRIFLLFPFIVFGVFVWLLPIMIEKHDYLVSYLPIFLMVGVIQNTQLFSFVSSMVLIDEKETGVAMVYGIVPLSKVQYIISRLVIPFLITVMLNILLLKVQPFYDVNWLSNITVSILAALVVPVFVLGINTLAKNRMQGLIYIKAFNMAILLPLAAYFVPDSIKNIFGIFPTHWIFQTIQNVCQDVSITNVSMVGFAFLMLLLVWVSGQFIRSHFM